MLELIGSELSQWDLDVQMRVATDQEVDEVHFANVGDAVALVVKPKMNNGEMLVDVPNILLQTSRKLMAYVYADGRTIKRISFEIKSKPKPETYAYTETEILNYRTLEERIQNLEKYGGGGGGLAARIGYVDLLAKAWEGEGNLFSQIVEIEGVTENTQVDLTPNVEQLAVFYEKDLAFVTENEDGVVTVYAIGQKPMNDYTIQVTMTEVAE